MNRTKNINRMRFFVHNIQITVRIDNHLRWLLQTLMHTRRRFNFTDLAQKLPRRIKLIDSTQRARPNRNKHITTHRINGNTHKLTTKTLLIFSYPGRTFANKSPQKHARGTKLNNRAGTSITFTLSIIIQINRINIARLIDSETTGRPVDFFTKNFTRSTRNLATTDITSGPTKRNRFTQSIELLDTLRQPIIYRRWLIVTTVRHIHRTNGRIEQAQRVVRRDMHTTPITTLRKPPSFPPLQFHTLTRTIKHFNGRFRFVVLVIARKIEITTLIFYRQAFRGGKVIKR